MKSRRCINLHEYSALSMSFILCSVPTQGQVIYTDFEPDTILEYSGGVLGIDLDNDGTFDFAFKNTVFSIYSTFYHTSFRYERILAGPAYTPLNLIAGSRKTFTGSYGGQFYRYYPYALEESAVITPPALDFQNWGFQRMAWADSIYIGGFINFHGGLWFPEKIEHFVGVRFIDADSLYHHGWIRCSVIDTGHTLIIHDYAYESQANHPIAAGSLETYVSVEEYAPQYSVYSFGSTIYLHLPIAGAAIEVFDLTGKRIVLTSVSDTYNTITINSPSGIYLVRITTETEIITRKVYLQF